MSIKKLLVKNFKSIKNLSLDCKKVNVFIGKPNTGKSNILEVIGLLSHICHGQINNFLRFEVLTDVFYDRILDDPIIVEFDDKVLEVKFLNGRFQGFVWKIEKDGTKTSFNVFDYDYFGGTPHYSLDVEMFKFYRFGKLKEYKSMKSEFLEPPDGKNLLSVVMTRKRLKEIFDNIFREFGYRPVFRPHEGKIEILKEIEDVYFSLPYSLASETLQRLVFYLAAIYSNTKSILTFEEPEAHAFPFYTKYLAERIAMERNENQYFIATHNPYFLTSILQKTPSEQVAIFVTDFKHYETKVKPLTKRQKEEVLEMEEDVFFNLDKFLSKRKG